MIKSDVWRYEWDAADRLTACTTPDGTRWTNRYDPLDRHVANRRHADDGAIVAVEHYRTHDTRYAASVAAWLDTVGNISEAAGRLTIHQNSLKYRLRRSRELFGLDLDDPDTCLSSSLQLRIGAGNAGRSKSWPPADSRSPRHTVGSSPPAIQAAGIRAISGPTSVERAQPPPSPHVNAGAGRVPPAHGKLGIRPLRELPPRTIESAGLTPHGHVPIPRDPLDAWDCR
ncbi:helix-turn-helix domain-containing protein [Streptomyces sp. NPDC055721]|uniref:helix-turn-helix domain-containing protein n=1 Tax=Streptomyces sp. NPDC127132 TaxID=3345374 RepID=UPI00363A9160